MMFLGQRGYASIRTSALDIQYVCKVYREVHKVSPHFLDIGFGSMSRIEIASSNPMLYPYLFLTLNFGGTYDHQNVLYSGSVVESPTRDQGIVSSRCL